MSSLNSGDTIHNLLPFLGFRPGLFGLSSLPKGLALKHFRAVVLSINGILLKKVLKLFYAKGSKKQ